MAAPKLGNAEKRSIARHMAVQAMYQHQMNETGFLQLLMEFRPEDDVEQEDQQMNAERWAADFSYFQLLLEQAIEEHDSLRDTIKPLLDRAWGSLDPVERSILLVCSSELKNQLEMPFRVVVNEAVELAKDMGAEDSFKYINGVMDKLSQDYRRFEVAAVRESKPASSKPAAEKPASKQASKPQRPARPKPGITIKPKSDAKTGAGRSSSKPTYGAKASPVEKSESKYPPRPARPAKPAAKSEYGSASKAEENPKAKPSLYNPKPRTDRRD